MTDQALSRQSLLTQTITQNGQPGQHNQTDPQAQQQVAVIPKVRLQSLDIYRGLTMIGMILVDNMGPVNDPPWFLDHAQWNGLTPADLIFPAFLFIMGMAIPLAVSEKRPVRLRNILRIVGLFLIGFFLNILGKKFDFQLVRILGILQRLSICYGVMILLHVVTGYANKYRRKLAGFFMFGLFCTYLAVMISFGGADRLGPNCTKDNNLTDKCNFAGFVDHLILTDAHCFKGGYTDPQGIFSTLGAILTTYMGYEFSLIMGRYKHNPKKLVINWLTISVIFGALVYPMTLLMPLNKKLYSASFTLIVVAVSGASLTFFYLVADLLPSKVPGSRKIVETVTAPLRWLGLNPLAIFVLMDVVAIVMIIYIKIDGVSLWTLFFRHAFKNWIDNSTIAAAVFACFFAIFWTVFAGIMHRFKLYVRL